MTKPPPNHPHPKKTSNVTQSDTVMPAVTTARYADQDMCYINRRPSRKSVSQPEQARHMSVHPDAANGSR